MKLKKKWPLLAVGLLASVAVIGCGGGSGGGLSTVPGPNSNVVGLLSDNRLLIFNAQAPQTTNTVSPLGLPAGQNFVGLDYRFAPDSLGTPGLYALAHLGGTNFQLYRIVISGPTAALTAIGPVLTTPLDANTIGFDFNPQVAASGDPTLRVDRIRVVSGNRTNLRIAPNTGTPVDSDPLTAGTQLDGTLTYDSSDPRAGTSPRVVGAAYTNNVATASPSGTINYGIDAATGNLVTQGRPDNDGAGPDTGISPNTGTLFTVGSLGLAIPNATGFDIGPAGTNNALLTNTNQLFSINLTSGAASRIGNISLPSGTTLKDLAILPDAL